MAYVIGGSGLFAPDASAECGNTTLVMFSDSAAVTITAGSQGLRFLFMAEKPLREPIAWQGPIVVNTEDELVQTVEEYWNGTFLGSR